MLLPHWSQDNQSFVRSLWFLLDWLCHALLFSWFALFLTSITALCFQLWPLLGVECSVFVWYTPSQEGKGGILTNLIKVKFKASLAIINVIKEFRLSASQYTPDDSSRGSGEDVVVSYLYELSYMCRRGFHFSSSIYKWVQYCCRFYSCFVGRKTKCHPQPLHL